MGGIWWVVETRNFGVDGFALSSLRFTFLLSGCQDLTYDNCWDHQPGVSVWVPRVEKNSLSHKQTANISIQCKFSITNLWQSRRSSSINCTHRNQEILFLFAGYSQIISSWSKQVLVIPLKDY